MEDICLGLSRQDKTVYPFSADRGTVSYSLDNGERIQKDLELHNTGVNGKLKNRFVDSFAKYTEVAKLTAEITADVLQEIIVYPDRRLEIVWNYRDELEKLLLDINMEDKAENAED